MQRGFPPRQAPQFSSGHSLLVEGDGKWQGKPRQLQAVVLTKAALSKQSRECPLRHGAESISAGGGGHRLPADPALHQDMV